MIEKPGVYKISSEEYHADPTPDPSLSRSVIKDLFDCSAKAWFNHPRLNPNFKADDGDGKFDVGTAAHQLLLEGLDSIEIIDAEDWRKKETKERRELARKNGMVPLLKHQFEEAEKMVAVAEEQIHACKELGITALEIEGDSELSYFWQEEGLWCKVRPDWINEKRDLIIDYKTTKQSANPADISRHIISMGYDIQAAFYLRGVKAIEQTSPKFVFVFQEVEEPFLCSFVGLDPAFLAMANQKIDYGIFLWGNCLSKNEWPAYPSKIAWVEPPAWAFTRWDAQATEIGL